MYASFIIGFHTVRMDNLLQTLRFLEEYHPEVVGKSEIVLVCQDNCEEIPNPHTWASSNLINMNLECMHLPKLTNTGVDAAKSEKLIILESDRVLPPGYFKQTIDQLHEGIQISTRNMIKIMEPKTDEQLLEGDFIPHRPDGRSKENKMGVRNMWSGNTACMKSDYNRVGKMDEAYTGYGWADSDMTDTMEDAGIESVWREEQELHLWHEDPTGYGETPEEGMFYNNGIHYTKKWRKQLPKWFHERYAKRTKWLI